MVRWGDYSERAATSEILRRAKVTKGAMYFHFPSKESPAQAIMGKQTGLVPVEHRAEAG
ncbi:TetR family transcriptional regulator [Streptomyces sp. NPDC001107]